MATAQKCVHKGCGKVFTDPEEDCVYHPGPPEFHEGQKGWKCCKPRFLTFDEFLEIPPCTTGKHSTIDENAPPPKVQSDAAAENAPKPKPIAIASQPSTTASTGPGATLTSALPTPSPNKPEPAPELEEDSDDPNTPVPENSTCKRRTCGMSSKDTSSRDEECTYHPGLPIFHEGSKGWTCCKRRVLEFDEFMKISGCKTRKGHCFVGKKNKPKADNAEEILEDVRNDFYQTPNTVIVSFYLKKIDKDRATVTFLPDGSGVDLDLPTSDGKRFKKKVQTFKDLDPTKCQSKIMGTKLEMVLAKQEPGIGWPVLRRGERDTGERIQVGKALRA